MKLAGPAMEVYEIRVLCVYKKVARSQRTATRNGNA